MFFWSLFYVEYSTLITGFEPFQSQCTWALKQALCAPYPDAKSWEPCFFTEVPDCPQTEAPNIFWIPSKGSQINLIRYAPFPEPSFICISKVPVNEPPPASPAGALLWRRLDRNKIYLATFSLHSKSKFLHSLFNTFAPIICLCKYLCVFTFFIVWYMRSGFGPSIWNLCWIIFVFLTNIF